MDRATSRLQDSLRTQSERSLAPGMHFPVDWEPYFNDSMTLLGIDHHSTQHYDHHRQQLTPRVRPAAVTHPVPWRTETLPHPLVQFTLR